MFLEVLPLSTVAKYRSVMHVPCRGTEFPVQHAFSIFVDEIGIHDILQVVLEFGFETDGLSFLFQLVPTASLFLLPNKTRKLAFDSCVLISVDGTNISTGSSGKIDPEFILDPCILFPITFRRFLA